MIWLLALGNLLYLVSYAVRGVVALRALAIAAGTCLIPYFLLRPDPLMGPVYWNLVFIGLNAWCITRHRRSSEAHEPSGLRTLPRSAVVRLQSAPGAGRPSRNDATRAASARPPAA